MTVNQYGADLARIHHEAFGDLAMNAAPAIVRHLRKSGIASGLVVDVGCGSGILARHLTNRGYRVLGIDASPAMLRIARRLAPRADFLRKRAEDIELPPCVAVVSTGEALTYLSASSTPAAHLRRQIRGAAAALVPGGLLMFDAIVEDAAPMLYRTWQARRHWVVLADVAEDRRRHIVTRHITTFVRCGSMYRRWASEHRVGVYARDAVLQELRASGFAARTLRSYGAAPLAPRRLVFHARLSR